MTIATVKTIMERIKVATPLSRILVMREGDKMNAVFADTVVSKQAIESGKDVVGVYHNQLSMQKMNDELNRAELNRL